MVCHLRRLQFAEIGREDRAAEVVRAPVGEAATGIVGVRPPAIAARAVIAVAAAGVVGLPRSRAEPEVPVDVRGRLLRGQKAELRRTAHADIDRLDRAKLARPAGIHDLLVIFQHTLAAAGDNTAVASGRGDHQRALSQRERLRLLQIDVLPSAAGGDCHDGVPMVGRGDVNGVDVVAGKQFSEIDVRCAVGVGILAVDAALALVPPLLPYIADGDILHVGPTEERVLIPRAHVADTDAPHHDPVASRRGRGIAEGLGGDDVGGGDRSTGGDARSLEKAATRGGRSLTGRRDGPGRCVVHHEMHPPKRRE